MGWKIGVRGVLQRDLQVNTENLGLGVNFAKVESPDAGAGTAIEDIVNRALERCGVKLSAEKVQAQVMGLILLDIYHFS